MRTRTFNKLCDQMQSDFADDLNQGSRLLQSFKSYIKELEAEFNNHSSSDPNLKLHKAYKNVNGLRSIANALRRREERLNKAAGLMERLFDDAMKHRKEVNQAEEGKEVKR